MTEVKLKGLSKRFGSTQAVDNVDWTANPGEFVVLFGPSGAGKTTTLKLIAGLETADAGEVYFDDRAMGEVDTADRNIAMAFENYALYPHLSVFDNIAFPLQVPGHAAKYTRQDVKRRVQETAQMLQIDMLLDRKPSQLSGGQRQRVALGRCLIREPAVCLMDEPIAHLDAKLRHRMYAELKRIQRERGTTTIYATPAQSEAMAMGDRIIVMRDGSVQQIGTPRDLYEQPCNVAVANFGGEQVMNILPAEVTADGDGTCFAVAGQQLPIPAPLLGMLQQTRGQRKLLVGVRPVDLWCSMDCLGPSSLPGTMYAMERLGRTTLITVQLGEQLIEVSTNDVCEIPLGTTVWLNFAEGRLHVFDAGTSRRLVSPLQPRPGMPA